MRHIYYAILFSAVGGAIVCYTIADPFVSFLGCIAVGFVAIELFIEDGRR